MYAWLHSDAAMVPALLDTDPANQSLFNALKDVSSCHPPLVLPTVVDILVDCSQLTSRPEIPDILANAVGCDRQDCEIRFSHLVTERLLTEDRFLVDLINLIAYMLYNSCRKH
ncbi:hypothetical protein J6590_073365 [Homalodisca vitripennis]|nr:hypothetical protein J6590_073365 [Homalodisca vitripennis]